jgi:hypothetical protein
MIRPGVGDVEGDKLGVITIGWKCEGLALPVGLKTGVDGTLFLLIAHAEANSTMVNDNKYRNVALPNLSEYPPQSS